MLFKIIVAVFAVIFSFRDESEKQLKKEQEEYKRIMGREYE